MAKATKKQALGRGLSALLKDPSNDIKSVADKNADKVVGSIVELELGSIEVNPFQPRTSFNEESLRELASSIKELGVIQPITVRKLDFSKYQLASGERRFRASKLVGLETIPAYIRIANDQESLEMALVENLQREDLNPIEEAQGYALLVEAFNLTQEETAQRVGKSRTTVTNALRLLNLAGETMDHLRAGRLTVGHAKVILGIEQTNHQNLIAERVIKESLSVRQTEELIADLLKDSSNSGKRKSQASPNREVHVTSLENRLKEKLGTKVSLTYRDGKGSLTIKYFSDEDLERILNILDIEA